jgi:hypothetical protein
MVTLLVGFGRALGYLRAGARYPKVSESIRKNRVAGLKRGDD